MSASATIVSSDLVELFDTVPDYQDYSSPESIKDFEADYRIALGRLAKGWGDQLLDLAEHPSVPLSHEDAQAIDTLLERISEVFEQLNAFRAPAFDPNSEVGRQRLQVSDGQILHTVESAIGDLSHLNPASGPCQWLDAHAGDFQRRLRRLSRELRRRNRLLRGLDSSDSTRHAPRPKSRPQDSPRGRSKR